MCILYAAPRFYAGLLPVLAGALPARAGYISALEGTRPFWQRRAEAAGMDGASAAAASNGAAGFAAVLVRHRSSPPVSNRTLLEVYHG